ncbi:MAG: hypothetical protein CEO12_591 [Parcubacteria group bacterium Gr01-1014_46]|nr:MAG: hypothetical protein CEO12_591 [Parcubacteria group bacterium Gr01-1014_46]
MGYYVMTYKVDSGDPKVRMWQVGEPFDATTAEAIQALEMLQRAEQELAHKEDRLPKNIQLWSNIPHFVGPK